MGIRVDTHCFSGYVVPPHYDSLLAKLVVIAPDRERAVRRMHRALNEFVVAGVPTTIPFLLRALDAPDFLRNRIHTRWVEETFMAEKSAEPSLA